MLNKEQIASEKLNSHLFTHRISADKAFIVVLSDIHEGINHRAYFKSIIDFILTIPNCYVIIGGDSINASIRGSKGNTTEEWSSGDKQIYDLVDDLKPLVDDNRIIAIGEDGNHNDRIYNDAYISVNKMIAILLGIREKYTGNMCIGMINVNKCCYTLSIIHKNRKTNNYYEYQRVDLLIKEHWHDLKYECKAVFDFNKTAKTISLVPTYEIYNGSFLNLPDYGMKAGYRPQFMGTYFIELSGKDRNISIWEDNKLYMAIKGGYKV
jgi:hypothetical protein